MATTIVTKNGTGAPTDSDLVAGELAVDLTNGRLYTTDLDSGGTVIEIGLNPSGNVDVTGTVTADGLTVGDTSDSQSLIQMLANSTDGANTIHFGDGTSADAYVGYINYAHDSNSMQFAAGGSTRATIDGATGNVGIGVSPSTKLHLGGAAPLDSIIRQDSTVSGTNWEIGERAAGKWQIWEDDTDSVVATFTSSGSVGIGTSSPAAPLDIKLAGTVTADIFKFQRSDGLVAGVLNYNGTDGTISLGTTTTHPLAFDTANTERMRIDANGNLLVGGTSYEQAGSIGFKGTGEYSSILSSGAGGEIYAGGAIALVSNGYQISVTTGNAQTYKWHNGTTRSMTLDSSGNLLVGTTTTPTSSAGNIVLANGTAPTASATDGVILYAEDVSSSSELKVRDEAGNITTLSPHNFDLIPQGPSEDMAWSYYSERDGKQINVDMLKAIRVLEKLSGEQLVFENQKELTNGYMDYRKP